MNLKDIHFISKNEVISLFKKIKESRRKFDYDFCIYEMPYGSIIEYKSKNYKILGFRDNLGPGGKYGSMECERIL